MSKINELRKTLPVDVFRIDSSRSILSFTRISLLLILNLKFIEQILLKYHNMSPLVANSLLIICIIFQALNLVGLFVLGHEAGHFLVHPNKWINDLIGISIFSVLLNSFYGWRVFHNFHHTHTQVKGIDPDWPELLLSKDEWHSARFDQKLAVWVGLGSPVGLIIGFWVGMIKRLLFPIFIPKFNATIKFKIKLMLQNFFCLIISIIFIKMLLSLFSLKVFMAGYLIPAIISATIGAFLTWIQHTQEDSYVFNKATYSTFEAQILSSYNVRFSKILEYFWLDINIHMPHHLSVRIPWYNLKPAMEIIKATNPEIVHEMPFSIKMMLRNFKMIYLKQIKQNGPWKLSDKYD